MPKRVENTTGELVEESSQDSKFTEVQVPRLVQFPGTADRLALGLSKADEEFNFRLASVQPQRATAAPPDFNSSITGSTAFYDWQSN